MYAQGGMPISVLQPAWLFPHSDACGDAERSEHGNDGRTAVGEERQRQAHDRQQTDIHKDIHKGLEQQHAAYADRNQRRNGVDARYAT